MFLFILFHCFYPYCGYFTLVMNYISHLETSHDQASFHSSFFDYAFFPPVYPFYLPLLCWWSVTQNVNQLCLNSFVCSLVECPEVEAAMDVSSAEPLDSEVLYDCVICGQSGPSTDDRPTGLVVLLQASSGERMKETCICWLCCCICFFI